MITQSENLRSLSVAVSDPKVNEEGHRRRNRKGRKVVK